MASCIRDNHEMGRARALSPPDVISSQGLTKILLLLLSSSWFTRMWVTPRTWLIGRPAIGFTNNDEQTENEMLSCFDAHIRCHRMPSICFLAITSKSGSIHVCVLGSGRRDVFSDNVADMCVTILKNTSSVSSTDWMFDTQLCKLRDGSGSLVL